MSQSLLKELFGKERTSLEHFFDHLDLNLVGTVLKVLADCQGLIILTGVGKSGIIAKKVAVTMTSTGTRAIYLSPTNALHGDIGIIKPDDVFVIFSKSGESDELLNLIPYVRNQQAKIISIVNCPNSRLEKASDLTLSLPEEEEICPFNLAPTTSTTIQMIIGDILAVALMRLNNFSLEQYATHHPAGRIGKRITLKVNDLMLKGEAVPICGPQDKLVDTLVELSNKQCGCVLITDEFRKLLGIFTDGDLRRSLQSQGSLALEAKMHNLMKPDPRWIKHNVLVCDAMKAMESDQKHPIMVLPVLDDNRTVLGLIKMHDIVQAGV